MKEVLSVYVHVCVHVVCPTCSPHSLPWALVVHVYPWKQLKLHAWINITGQWLWAEWEDSIHVSLLEAFVQASPWHTRQHQYLGIWWGILNTSIYSTITEYRRWIGRKFYPVNLQQNIGPRSFAQGLIVNTTVVQAVYFLNWLKKCNMFKYEWVEKYRL